MIQRVVVLGGGSAGLITAIALKTKLPNLRVTILRSRELGVIGVGEGTMPDFPAMLHGYLGIDPAHFHRQVMPAPKLGAKLLWGPRKSFNFSFGINVLRNYKALSRPTGFYCQDDMEDLSEASSMISADRAYLRDERGEMILSRDVGYHVDNERLVRFLETHAQSVGVVLLDEKIIDVEQADRGIRALRAESGTRYEADLFIDSSGFASKLLGQTLKEAFVSYSATLFCDRSVVGDWPRDREPIQPYTLIETMNAGWCWRIDHPDRVARGYVYSSAFLTDDEAETEFRAKNPNVSATRLLKFPSGRYRNTWVKNVVAVGNAAGFVEPLGATALAMICREARRLTETLRACDCEPGPAIARIYNSMSEASWDGIRDFLAVHYRFNTRLDTAFWKACRADVDLAGARDLVDFYQEEGPHEWGLNLMRLQPAAFSFLPDAFYCILLGQCVPYRRDYRATPQEQEFLSGLRAHHHGQAANALRPEECLQTLRQSHPRWDSNFFASGSM